MSRHSRPMLQAFISPLQISYSDNEEITGVGVSLKQPYPLNC